MERISFVMMPDSHGRITVTNTVKHIMENVPEIKVPDMDITQIPLAALSLTNDATKHCIDGYAEGKKWIKDRYTEYEFTLIFG